MFPFEDPYLSFQRRAMRAEACDRSPLTLLTHPDYGLWRGYRGALLFAAAIELTPGNLREQRVAAVFEPGVHTPRREVVGILAAGLPLLWWTIRDRHEKRA